MACEVILQSGDGLCIVVDGAQVIFKKKPDGSLVLCLFTGGRGCGHATLRPAQQQDLRFFLSPVCPWLVGNRPAH